MRVSLSWGSSISQDMLSTMRPRPAVRSLAILAAVVAVPMPAFLVLVPVSLFPLIPLIAMGAFPAPFLAVMYPMSLLTLIPIVFVGSNRIRREGERTNQNRYRC